MITDYIVKSRLWLVSAEGMSLMSTALRMGANIIILPLVLIKIPKEDMGVWYLFVSLGAIAPIFDLGFSGTIARFASMFHSGAGEVKANSLPLVSTMDSNLPGLCRLMKVAGTLYTITALCMFLALAVMGPCFAFHGVDPKLAQLTWSFEWWAYAIVVVFSLYSQYPVTILRGMGEVSYAQGIQMFGTCMYLIGVVGGILSGMNIKSMILGLLLNDVAIMTIALIKLKKMGVGSTGAVDWELFKTMVPNSFKMAIVSAGAYLIYNSNMMLCSRYLGASEAASYGLSNQLIGVIDAASAIFVVSKSPSFTRFLIHKQTKQLNEVFWQSRRRGIFLYIIGVLFLFFAIPLLLNYIKSGTELLPINMLLFFSFYRFLEFHHGQFAILVFASNRIPFAIPALASGLTIFIVGTFMVQAYGIWGLLITTGISQAIFNNWYPVLLGKKILNTTP